MAISAKKSPTNLAGRGLMKKGGSMKKYAMGSETFGDKIKGTMKGPKNKPTPKGVTKGAVATPVFGKKQMLKKGGSTKMKKK